MEATLLFCVIAGVYVYATGLFRLAIETLTGVGHWLVETQRSRTAWNNDPVMRTKQKKVEETWVLNLFLVLLIQPLFLFGGLGNLLGMALLCVVSYHGLKPWPEISSTDLVSLSTGLALLSLGYWVWDKYRKNSKKGARETIGMLLLKDDAEKEEALFGVLYFIWVQHSLGKMTIAKLFVGNALILAAAHLWGLGYRPYL